jgi:hypothetical protein
VDEKVWDFFFIDEFGILTPRWNLELDEQEPRAVSTMSIVSLDRQALQQTRQSRLRNLKQQVSDSIAAFNRGDMDKKEIRRRSKEWLKEPFQPDVADYFLNGPGKSEKPFSKLFEILNGS